MAQLFRKRDIEKAIIAEEDPARIRAQVLEDLFRECDADLIGLLDVVPCKSGNIYGRADLHGAINPGVQAIVGTPCLPALNRVIRRPHPIERNRYIDDHIQARLLGLKHWRDDEAKRQLWDTLGFKSQVRMMVFNNRRFVTFVGIWRFLDRPEFSAREQDELNRNAELVTNRLITADMLEESANPKDTLHLVTDEDGNVLHASAPAREWLKQGNLDSLRAIISQVHRGHRHGLTYLLGGMSLKLVPMDTNQGVLSYLVHLSPRHELCTDPDSELTPTQREIAHLAANGSTIEEIASMLGRSPHTVKTHLRNIYERLVVSNRVELAEAIQQN